MLLFFLLILIILFSSSCTSEVKSSRPQTEEKIATLDRLPTPEPEVEEEKPTQEAIYTYNPEADYNLSPMTYEGGPRLTGIIWGDRPLAVIEFLEQGFVVGTGEEVCGYKIKAITSSTITLTAHGKSYTVKLNKG
jgi:hypothetical protein